MLCFLVPFIVLTVHNMTYHNLMYDIQDRPLLIVTLLMLETLSPGGILLLMIY
jgi:hypothetical protein